MLNLIFSPTPAGFAGVFLFNIRKPDDEKLDFFSFSCNFLQHLPSYRRTTFL